MPPWAVEFRPAVAEVDLAALPRNLRSRVLRAIETRLTAEPARYGQRLRRSLAGFWKIRVGDYRVVYEILGTTVVVWAILNRKGVYDEMQRRRPR